MAMNVRFGSKATVDWRAPGLGGLALRPASMTAFDPKRTTAHH